MIGSAFFDKRLCGKWKSEKFEINGSETIIFLNIEWLDKEKKAKVTGNFDKAFFANEVLYVEYSYNTLYFFHNDYKYRAEYILALDNDSIIKCDFFIKNCFGMSGVFERKITFNRMSEEEEEKYKYVVEPKNMSRLNILKEYAEYGLENLKKTNYIYKFDEYQNMKNFIENNNLNNLVKDKKDFEIAIELMNWLCGQYKHGDIGFGGVTTPQAIMEFADKNEKRTNCRGLSIILAHLLRAYNLRAFHLTCMPYEEPFSDCHVIVSVYCESIKKWIMLDPTYNLYLKNKNGEIISADEFRECLINNDEITTNDNCHKNIFSIKNYSNYMAKNFIRLERGTSEYYGCDENDGRIILLPEKYYQNEINNFKNQQIKNDYITTKEEFWSD